MRVDLEAPPPLLLLPLRLQYRVVDTDVPIRVSGNVRELFRDDATISIETPTPAHTPVGGAGGGAHAAAQPWRLDATAVTFNTQREIWFRWFPDDDFALHFRQTSHGITQLFAPFGAQAWAPPLLADAVVDISADSPHG